MSVISKTYVTDGSTSSSSSFETPDTAVLFTTNSKIKIEMKERVRSLVYLCICGLFKDTDSVSHVCVCVCVCVCVWVGALTIVWVFW
jgi:hypothetical protein